MRRKKTKLVQGVRGSATKKGRAANCLKRVGGPGERRPGGEEARGRGGPVGDTVPPAQL